MSDELPRGTRLGDFTIEEFLGRGGMGYVYRALQSGLDRAVALKVIAPHLAEDPMFRGRFRREARLAAAVHHPAIIPIYAAGESDGRLYLAMYCVAGLDLGSLIFRERRIALDRALRIAWQIAGALDTAHANGLIHRDVKPSNILIEPGTAGQELAYLTDFGLVRGGGDVTLTATGSVIGSPAYMSPEQVKGDPQDGRSDQYSLACVIYEMLTGQPPFPREGGLAMMYAQIHADRPELTASLPELPSECNAVIARGLAKDPSERYDNCSDLVTELAVAAGASAQTPVIDPPVLAPPAATPPGAPAGYEQIVETWVDDTPEPEAPDAEPGRQIPETWASDTPTPPPDAPHVDLPAQSTPPSEPPAPDTPLPEAAPPDTALPEPAPPVIPLPAPPQTQTPSAPPARPSSPPRSRLPRSGGLLAAIVLAVIVVAAVAVLVLVSGSKPSHARRIAQGTSSLSTSSTGTATGTATSPASTTTTTSTAKNVFPQLTPAAQLSLVTNFIAKKSASITYYFDSNQVDSAELLKLTFDQRYILARFKFINGLEEWLVPAGGGTLRWACYTASGGWQCFSASALSSNLSSFIAEYTKAAVDYFTVKQLRALFDPILSTATASTSRNLHHPVACISGTVRSVQRELCTTAQGVPTLISSGASSFTARKYSAGVPAHAFSPPAPLQ